MVRLKYGKINNIITQQDIDKIIIPSQSREESIRLSKKYEEEYEKSKKEVLDRMNNYSKIACITDEEIFEDIYIENKNSKKIRKYINRFNKNGAFGILLGIIIGSIASMSISIFCLENAELKGYIKDQSSRIDQLIVVSDIESVDVTTNYLLPEYTAEDDDYINILTPQIPEDKDTIFKSTITGEEFAAEELSGRKLLLSYKDGDEESFFYGQFNENNHWDGNCIVNTYKDNRLILIMDAVYNDGELISYKQIMPSSTKDKDIWIVSERKNEGEWNSGSSWIYYRKGEKSKTFETDEVVLADILDVHEFEAIIEDNGLEGYYFGRTSNGYYNDETGNAYLVKYAEDGTIRMLYSGSFKNGEFNDDTGAAWQIVFDNSVNRYFYYNGIFINGNRKENVNKDNYITQEQIANITKGMTINSELNWFDTE